MTKDEEKKNYNKVFPLDKTMVYERRAIVRHDRDMCMAWHVLLFFVRIFLFSALLSADFLGVPLLVALFAASSTTLAASLVALGTFAGSGALASSEGELSGSKSVGKFHLCANCVGQVGNDQDILDVVVTVEC